MKTETIKILINKNKDVLYSSGMVIAAFAISFAILLFKEDGNICQDAKFLILSAGFIAFACIRACTVYKKKTEEYLATLTTNPLKALAATVDATMITTILFIVIATLSEGVPVISCSLLTGLAVLIILLFIASIFSIVIFSVLAE